MISWEGVSDTAALGMPSFPSAFSGCLPRAHAMCTHGFAPQVCASQQDVSVHRMDPDSWGKHVWKMLPSSYKSWFSFLCDFFSILNTSVV